MTATILKGIAGVLASRKGVLTLIVIAVSSAALFMGKITGLEYGGIITTVTAFYGYHQVAEQKVLAGSGKA